MSGRNVQATVKTWFVAARPHTLSAAVVPVLVGSALVFWRPGFSGSVCGWTLVASLLVQIGANFVDEYSDHGTTASAHKYLAPHKVIARGLLTPGQVRTGAAVVFGAATLIGAGLVWRAGWPLLLLCMASLAVAYLYSGGPLPLGDYALGEPLVFVTMGPVMVMGTVYAQVSEWEVQALVYSLPVAALVTAILVANNLRDGEEDRRNGRKTVVTVFGEGAMRAGWLLLVGLAFAVTAWQAATRTGSGWLLLPWLTLPLAIRVALWILRGQDRDTLHRALRGTSALHLSFGVLLSAGLAA
jgi:1,4-dihydroxy-2-naphthoate octaprenyltransferase